ncbi:MAG TPA: polysaccharide deacetylase family protein [Acidobacteriota bacterium]|jgi:peptidoglycan/xylan/chitin deacetylase (PgdA/CDA1 family)|nr:polysaccharide deacetylase family protein [Acidobacteriota bacterium]
MFFLIAGVLVLAGYLVLFCRSIFILAYHGVGIGQTRIPGLLLEPQAFRKQMRLLAALGFRNKSVDAIVDEIQKGKSSWWPTVSITFDDGYRNVRDNALPVLQRIGWAATIFVPTDYVGKTNEWDRLNDVPSLALLDWSDLALLHETGISIGSHGKRHWSLVHLSKTEAAAELRESLLALQSQLAGGSRVFSYPFGQRHPELSSLLQEAGYKGACSLVAGALPDSSQLFDLGRLLVRSNNLFGFFFSLALYPIKSLARKLRLKLRGY